MRLATLALGASLAVLVGCSDDSEEGPRAADVTAEVDDSIATVVHVRWKTSGETRGRVEYGSSGEFEFSTPLEAEASGEHEVALLGLVEDTEYDYRVVLEEPEETRSATFQVRTETLPGGMPRLSVDGTGADQWIVVPILGATTAVTIVDPAGNIVWYHQDERDLDFYRARLSLDGKSLLYNAASVSGDPSEDSELVRVALDGSGSSSVPVPLLAHDFVEHPDGTIGAIVVEYRDFEGTELRGDSIVEVDESGDIKTVWSAWDCFDPSEVLGEDPEHGWTFANALDYDPVEEAYYLGMRNFSSIAKIDRKTGECEWVLGATAPTLEFKSGSARFLHQHQFQVVGDHLLVMDNDGSPGNESRILEYALDFDANQASEVWSYTADPVVYSFVLGEPTRLANGKTFVNWSAAGQMDLVDEDGKALWKLNTDVGYVFGFNTLAASLYPELP